LNEFIEQCELVSEKELKKTGIK